MKIISFVSSIEKVFTQIFLVQYLTSIIVICNIGFQLVHVHIQSIQFVNMCFYFMAMIVQLSIYCWNGNEIILKSTATRDACYNSNWIKCGSSIRKMLFIISERSKRPLYLSAGKFSKLSLATFTSVINSSYSYFTLMQRMDSKNKH
ncbi:odorant receptor 94a-like [Aethina tumida]|uniref:odorant receptor 94a-like n=1 Tax=Aethina tumida TaxID=116153 RepID=UPI0021478F6F|nr:odorant receptor 94a-like [Aethina tumida]